MKIIATFFISFFISNLYSQSDDTIIVSFKHHNSMIITSEIYISFIKDFKEKKSSIYVKTSKGQNQYTVSDEKATNLINVVSNLSANDIIQDVRKCLDGSDTEIKIQKKNLGTSVSYSINCLSIIDENMPWRDFFKAVNLILDIANHKFSDLN